MISDELREAIDALVDSADAQGAIYARGRRSDRSSAFARTVQARAALVAAIEREVEAARQDGYVKGARFGRSVKP